MNFGSDEGLKELFSEVDIFINKNSLENVDVSLHKEEFNYISLKLAEGEEVDIESLNNYFQEKFQSSYYIITTLVAYLDSPELKKYYIPHNRLNEFLYVINDPEFEEEVISITQAEEE